MELTNEYRKRIANYAELTIRKYPGYEKGKVYPPKKRNSIKEFVYEAINRQFPETETWRLKYMEFTENSGIGIPDDPDANNWNALMSSLGNFWRYSIPAPHKKKKATMENIPPRKEHDLSESTPLTTLYRIWCEQNGHVCTDAELGHFTHHTPAAFTNARSMLTKEGWEFTKNGTGWNVKRSEKPKYTESQYQKHDAELRAQHQNNITQLQEHFQQLIAEYTSKVLAETQDSGASRQMLLVPSKR